MAFSKVASIKKTKLSDAIGQKLLQMIRDGLLDPGQKLPPETELCNILGVSRTALREAIRALSGMKILKIMHGKGTYVGDAPDILVEEDVLSTILARESLEHMIEVRATLDIGIARYAALKATNEDLEEINRAILLMEQSTATDPPNWEHFHMGDRQFHHALCKATHNPLFEKVGWPLVKYTIKRGWKSLLENNARYYLAIEQHRNILEAVKGGDEQGAMTNMKVHLDTAFGRLLGAESAEPRA
jgi:GntR family transcriptional repressor for pyruvate dehydrogenase complex